MQATLHWVLLFLNIRYAGLEKLVCCVCVEMLAVVTSYEGLLAACHYSVVTIIITRVFIFHLIIIVSSTNKYKLNTALSRHCHPDTHTAVLFTFVSIHRICSFIWSRYLVFSAQHVGCGPIGGSDSPTDNPLCFMFPSSQKPRCGGSCCGCLDTGSHWAAQLLGSPAVTSGDDRGHDPGLLLVSSHSHK